MKKIISTSALILLLSLTGCVSQDFKDAQHNANAVHDAITDLTRPETHNKVEHVNSPPQRLTPLVKATPIPYLSEPISLKASDWPLSIVIAQIMQGVEASIWFDEEVDPNLRVNLIFKGTRGDMLNLLARQTGYGITPLRDKVEIRKYVSETFDVHLPSGKYSGQLGSQGASSGEGDKARIEGQFVNVTYANVDVFSEIAKGIRVLLRGKDDKTVGTVQEMQSLSMVTVRTTPARMQGVKRFVATYNAALSQQVLLDIQVLSFQSNLGHENGIDWNIIKEVGKGTLQFFVPGTNTVSKGAGYGLAFQGTGKWNGTSAFIKALEQQGSVSASTPITALVLNNQPAHLSENHRIPYIGDMKVTSDDNGLTTDIARAQTSEGVDMMVTPNVLDSHVWLRISGKLVKIVGDNTQVVNEVSLRFLPTEESEFTFTNKLRYGQTYVIASVRQDVNQVDKTKNFGSRFLGGAGSIHQTTETLVLLTPRRAE